MARTALLSLRNEDYPDRELLYILDDQSDADGWASTDDLMGVIKISHPDGGDATKKDRERYAKHCISTRYSWMKRYGWVMRDENAVRWGLTDVGRDLMHGKLTKGVMQSLDRMKPGDRVILLQELGKAFASTNQPTADMMRRMWQHGVARRNGRR